MDNSQNPMNPDAQHTFNYGENPNQINYTPNQFYENQNMQTNEAVNGYPYGNPNVQNTNPNGYYGDTGYNPYAQQPPYSPYPYNQQQPYEQQLNGQFPPQQNPYSPQQGYGHGGASFDSRNVIRQINQQRNMNGENMSTKRLGARFLAFILDGIISTIPNYLLALLFIMPTVRTATNTLAYMGEDSIFNLLGMIAGQLALMSIISMVVYLAYYVVLPVYVLQGRTLGKKMMKLRIVSIGNEDEIPDLKTMLMREIVGKFVSSILWIGYFMILFSKNHVGLHDKIAKTRVIDDELETF